MHADKVISEARAKIMCGESTFSVRNFLIASGFSSAVADSILAEFRSIKRPLNFGEADVLRIVEEEYGPQNLDQNLSFTPANYAELVIESSGRQMVTAICLTSFALSMEQGKVDERELRNDWIRDSRSMLNHHWNSNPSLFRLAWTLDGDLVLIAGKRRIEIWQEQHCSKGAVEYVLHLQHTHHWECPFHVEPITQPLREDIVRIISKLLETRANEAGVSLKIKVEW